MKTLKLFLLLFLLGIYFLPTLLAAAEPAAGEKNPGNPASAPVKLNNPLTGTASSVEIPALLGKIINYIMGIVGSLALVMFIYGGLTWMISGGNTEQVTKGKQIIIWATLGIAVIFTAYALVRFVISAIST